jgi:hypothetical protein
MATEADATEDGPTGSDGTAQLQRAAREVLGAARSFLDAVEELVEDRDKLHGAVETVTGVVSDLVAKVTPSRPSPWGEPEDADDGWTDEGWSNEQAWSADPAADDRPDDGSDDEPEGPAPAAKKVRKIQVD